MGRWIRVATSDAVREGEITDIIVNQDVIVLARDATRLFAIDGLCAHQGGPLAQGRLADGCIVCPWHGWQYDLQTGNNAKTCQRMLKTYPVREENGVIEIDMGFHPIGGEE